MWTNPADTSSESALGTADASYENNPISELTWTNVRIGCGTGVTVVVDDMTAATTFNEAIPEPAVLVMVVLFGGGLLFIRRKLAV